LYSSISAVKCTAAVDVRKLGGKGCGEGCDCNGMGVMVGEMDIGEEMGIRGETTLMGRIFDPICDPIMGLTLMGRMEEPG